MRLCDELMMPKTRTLTRGQYLPHQSFQTGNFVFVKYDGLIKNTVQLKSKTGSKLFLLNLNTCNALITIKRLPEFRCHLLIPRAVF